MKKKISLGARAREELFCGAEKLASLARTTMGPGGHNIITASRTGAYEIASSGGSISGDSVFADVTENAGAILLRRAGEAVRESCGDGYASAAVIAESILRGGARLIAAGYSPAALRRGIDKSLPAAADALSALTLREPSREQLERAVSLAAKDEVIGKLVCQALSDIDYAGEISVKASDTGESYVWADGSFSVSAGYQSKYMVTNDTLQEAVLQDAAVFVCACAINSIQDILPLLDECSIRKQPLFILAESVSPAVVKSFVSNIAQGVISVCSVEAPGVGAGKLAILEDAAARTGTVVFGTPLHPDTRSAGLCDCGRADKVKVSLTRSAVYGGKAKPDELDAHIRKLEAMLHLEHNELEDERLRQRLANLKGLNAELRVGAVTESERRFLAELAESAVKAARSGARSGLLPGGGTAYIRAVPALRDVSSAFSEEERAGAALLMSALEQPARTIAANAGFNGTEIAARLRDGEGFFGFDVSTGKFLDLAEAGILDPADTVLCALNAAASVGAQFLTAEAAVLIAAAPVSAMPVPDDLHITPQDFL